MFTIKIQKKYLSNSSEAKKYTLILDVGTTGVKAFIFSSDFEVVIKAYRPLKKFSPQPGWVEQDPRELVDSSLAVLQEAIQKSGLGEGDFIGLGITNQRETTILWNTKTGELVYNAIVWEDARTTDLCSQFKEKYDDIARNKTGLYINSYFSASKIRWILENIPKAQELLKEGLLAFGTVDSWILWNLGEGHPHLTDNTNASRTLLFNIREIKWDNELCDIFSVPMEILPQVKTSSSFFGDLKKEVIGFSLPILAICGDQQASMYAAGTDDGTTKVTYGTGTFISQMIGKEFKLYPDFLTTIMPGKEPLYVLEEKVQGTGKEAQDSLKDPKALKTYLGQIAEQVNEHLKKLPVKPKELIIDGGITRDGYLAKIQADISGIPTKNQKTFDGTALGGTMLIRP